MSCLGSRGLGGTAGMTSLSLRQGGLYSSGMAVAVARRVSVLCKLQFKFHKEGYLRDYI